MAVVGGQREQFRMAPLIPLGQMTFTLGKGLGSSLRRMMERSEGKANPDAFPASHGEGALHALA